MNTQPHTGAFATHLRPVLAESWSAWKLGERESDPIAVHAETLDEAVRQAMSGACFHPGDTLAVLYTHAGRNKQTLWLYAIKRSTKNYSWRAATDGGKPVKVCALDAKLICETAVEAFQPVERFDAFRDDAVGVDRGLVEVRS